jgi:hypothetical protein
MDLFSNPSLLPLLVAVIFFAGVFYVRNLSEKALAYLTPEEKGLWMDGMRINRKKVFYVVMGIIGLYVLLMIFGSSQSWYAQWDSQILLGYFILLMGTFVWSHYLSIGYLKENNFSHEAIGLLTKAFWVRAVIYILPLSLLLYSSDLFR